MTWRLALLLPAGLYLATLGRYARQLAPDGYDGVGFVLALERFDLARFQPQPPGYPLLVVLGRLLHALGLSPVAALAAVSALLLGGGIAAAAALLRQRAGVSAGWLCLCLLALAPLCWALGTATLSDGAGLGAVLLAVAVSARPGRPAALGGSLLFGLALGLRPSYLPLALPLFVVLWQQRGWRRCGLVAAGVVAGVVAWLLPLALCVGPQRLLALSLHHLHGHVYEFGGTVASPSEARLAFAGRLWALAAGVLQGAFGPLWSVAMALVLGLIWRGAPCTARDLRRGLLLVLLCWSAFVLLGQPLRGHGRHLLPLVVALLMLVALAGGAVPGRGGVLLRLALLLCVGLPAARTLAALRGTPPAGAQLARFVAAHYPAGTPLYGARAARYLDWLEGSGAARPARYLGEVIVDMEHRDRPPREALITSEVQAAPASRPRLRSVARFCPPAVPVLFQFDAVSSAAPCVELLAYRVWP